MLQAFCLQKFLRAKNNSICFLGECFEKISQHFSRKMPRDNSRVLPHPQWRLRSGLSPERAGNGKPGGIQGTILTSAPLILCLVKGIHVSSVDYVKRTSFLMGELNSQSHLHKSVLNLRNKVYTLYLLIPLLYILFQVPMYNWNMNLLPTGNKIVYVFFWSIILCFIPIYQTGTPKQIMLLLSPGHIKL